jgi:hypothetical protein
VKRSCRPRAVHSRHKEKDLPNTRSLLEFKQDPLYPYPHMTLLKVDDCQALLDGGVKGWHRPSVLIPTTRMKTKYTLKC